VPSDVERVACGEVADAWNEGRASGHGWIRRQARRKGTAGLVRAVLFRLGCAPDAGTFDVALSSQTFETRTGSRSEGDDRGDGADAEAPRLIVALDERRPTVPGLRVWLADAGEVVIVRGAVRGVARRDLLSVGHGRQSSYWRSRKSWAAS